MAGKFLNKVMKTKEGWSTGVDERFSYYLYFCGQNAIYQMVFAFLTSYLMISGVDMIIAGVVMLGVKVWDAVNDALFGMIFDKIKFKSGKKYLPWLKLSTILIPIATVILFAIPAGSPQTVKLVWFAIAYIVWDTCYTLCDVPIYGLVTSMTERIDERTSMLSFKGIWIGVGTGIAYLCGFILVSEFVGAPYWAAALVVAVIAFITMMPVCFKAKERIMGAADDTFTFRKMFGYLFKNKYLLIYYIGFIVQSGLAFGSSLTQYASFYLFDNSLIGLMVMAIGAAPALVLALFVPKIIRKIDKMKLYLGCMIVYTALSFVMYFVGYDTLWVFVVLSLLRGLPFGVVGVMMFMFTPDCAEYGQYKTGVEAKGITFAIQTFSAKITAAMSGSLGMMILGLFGWASVNAESFEELKELGVEQTPQAMEGLWITYTLIPAIGCLIGCIIWMFYKLRDKDVQIMADCNAGKITREQAESMLSRKY